MQKLMSWLGGQQLVLMAIAGTLGTLSRYWLSGFVQRLCGVGFPWGTLVVNVLGCLFFGFVWTLSEEWHAFTDRSRLVILTGFMGAFTTFSTFAFDTAEMLAHADWWRAVANLLLQNVVGIAAVLVGFAIARAL